MEYLLIPAIILGAGAGIWAAIGLEELAIWWNHKYSPEVLTVRTWKEREDGSRILEERYVINEPDPNHTK